MTTLLMVTFFSSDRAGEGRQFGMECPQAWNSSSGYQGWCFLFVLHRDPIEGSEGSDMMGHTFQPRADLFSLCDDNILWSL